MIQMRKAALGDGEKAKEWGSGAKLGTASTLLKLIRRPEKPVTRESQGRGSRQLGM